VRQRAQGADVLGLYLCANRTAEIEQRLHGRTRRSDDEGRFGIHRAQYAARMHRPNPKAQWSGIVTALGARLLEQGRVEAVITTGAAPGTRFKSEPVLARTPADVLATAGNKPCLSPNLSLPRPSARTGHQASGLHRYKLSGAHAARGPRPSWGWRSSM
jgi:coenzyme F420-reducing hydrogenase beta subunit